MSQIVILGGGVGGLATALKVRKKLPSTDKITLIDRQAKQYFYPSLLWLMIGKRKEDKIYRSLKDLPSQGIEFIHDEVKLIEPESKEIILNNDQSISYDILVIATGADYDEEAFPQLSEVGYNLYTIEGITAFRPALNSFKGGRVVILVTELPFKCPAAPYEAAFLLNWFLKKRGLENKFEIDIYTPESKPAVAMGEAMSKRINQELSSQAISLYTDIAFKGVDSSLSYLKFDNREADFDLLLYISPHQPSKVIRNSNLGNEAGWIPADRHYLNADYDDLFVIGDAAAVSLPSGGYLPKAGVITTFQSYVTAKNVAAVAKGKVPYKRYDGNFGCIIDIGAGKSLAGFGNLYRHSGPTFHFLPKSRLWRLGKRYVEYRWLKEGTPID